METRRLESTNADRPRGFRLWRKKEEEIEELAVEESGDAIARKANTFRRVQGMTFDPDLAGLFGGLSTANLLGRVGTAARCLQLVAQQIAAAPLRYRRETPAPAGKDYAPPWVASPDPAWYPNGIADAIHAAVWSIYAQGDAFLWTTSRNADGYPATWTVLDPLRVKVDAANGSRTYAYGNVPLNAGDVLQITRNPTGALRGTGALAAYATNLLAAFQGDEYAADVLAGGGVPSAVLKSARRLTADQAAEVQAQWIARVASGSRLSAPAVLPPDLDFEALAFSPKDLTLLETREWDAKQIAAAFGVPAPLLNMTLAGGLTYQNPAALFDLWWRSELTPASKKIEAALSTWLPRGSWVEFDSTASRAPDFPGLSATWIALVAAKIATPDEARAAVLDLPPAAQGEQIELIDEPPGANASVGSAPAVESPEPSGSPSLEVVQ